MTTNEEENEIPSLLGLDVSSGLHVCISQRERRKGLYGIGKNGTCKATCLVNLMLQDINAGMGLCFLDPAGDAITDILRRLPAERIKDVIVLDVMDKNSAFGLSLYACANPDDNEQVTETVSF